MTKNALKSSKRELDHIRLYKAGGGTIVEAYYKDKPRGPDDPYEPNPPEPHVFTKGADMLAHVAKHMGVAAAKEEAGEKEAK